MAISILSFEVLKINAQSVTRAIDISGYWGTELKDDHGTQTFIFEISKDSSGTYQGYVHSYSNQVKLPKLKLRFIKLKESMVRWLK